MDPNATAQDPAPLFSIADRERLLIETGLRAGSPVMIRIFKNESELELWIERQGRFELFRTYRICFWSGTLGPKLREGDRQAPEGFYSVDAHQLRLTGRNARSFYIDFPNALDRALARTGSAIMVHGRCASTGCFAMTNPAMEEIYALVERALQEGQDHIEVHAFPFRMSASNLAAHAYSEWREYWLSLKEGYDLFEQTHIPPKVSVCGGRYVVEAAYLPRQATTAPDRDATSSACETEGPDQLLPLGSEAHIAPAYIEPQTVAHNRYAPGAGIRNARKAYAAARRARMAAHVKRMRTSGAAARTRRE
jgi:murein L,D-transpeptidase YafK